MKTFSTLAHLWHAELFSPKDFFRRACLLAVLFALVHLAGLREYSSFLSGTMGNPAMSQTLSGTLGLIYVIAYFGAIILAPILLIAALLLCLWTRIRKNLK